LKQLDGHDKDKETKGEIQEIYYEHKGNYGYLRITLELRNCGFVVNQKKVQRLINLLGLSSQIRRKRKYSSYKGEIGKKADNFIQRQFEASKPYEKMLYRYHRICHSSQFTKAIFITCFRWL